MMDVYPLIPCLVGKHFGPSWFSFFLHGSLLGKESDINLGVEFDAVATDGWHGFCLDRGKSSGNGQRGGVGRCRVAPGAAARILWLAKNGWRCGTDQGRIGLDQPWLEDRRLKLFDFMFVVSIPGLD